jgi:hypothetical protein
MKPVLADQVRNIKSAVADNYMCREEFDGNNRAN